MKNGNGNGTGTFAGMLFGFIVGSVLALYVGSKACDGYYERGYNKAKDEARIASLEEELEKVKGTEVEEKAEEA